MTTNDIEAVIGMLTDQLSRGVEKAAPLAQEFLRQYVMREGVFAASLFICALVCTAISYRVYRSFVKAKENSVDEFGFIMVLSLFGFASAGLYIGALVSFGHCLAPLPSLLGR